jgi:glycosyltransferase involved in cell wall biosynthesis
MKQISIVTTSFNQAEFIEQAILSVLTQNYPDIEYSVVDPGSTDGSRDIIERYRSRISKVILHPDRGAADGLNCGFAEATGEIFGFLNADDFLLQGALSQVAEFFELHPECDMVMGNGYIVDAHGRSLRHVTARDFTVRRYLYSGTLFLQQSTFFRSEAFRRSPGFNIENRTCWDGELFVSMVKMGTAVGYLDADISGFRIHGASISGSGRLEDVYRKDCRRIFRQIYGRDWHVTDELLRFIYRCEGLLLRALSWSKAPARKRDLA